MVTGADGTVTIVLADNSVLDIEWLGNRDKRLLFQPRGTRAEYQPDRCCCGHPALRQWQDRQDDPTDVSFPRRHLHYRRARHFHQYFRSGPDGAVSSAISGTNPPSAHPYRRHPCLVG